MSSLRKTTPRKRGGRHACIALLTGAILFFLFQFAAAVAFDYWLPGAIDPDYGVRFRRIQQGRADDPAHTRTVVMLGSSRTYYGLQAETLDAPLSRQLGRPVSVVNFGFAGGGPMTELLTWQRLKRNGIKPDLVLIEVFPSFLDSTISVDDAREDRMPINRLSWHDVRLLESHGAGRTRPGLRRDFLETAAVMLYSHRLAILNDVAPRLLYSKWGKKPVIERLAPDPFPTTLTQQDRDKALEFQRNGYLCLRDFHLGGRHCEALRELLASCRRAGAPAALVLMPEGPEFRSWYPPEVWRQIQNWVEQISQEEGASLINAREWIEEDDFLDSHHLLSRGAARFTERLGRESILPLLRRQS